MLPAGRRQVSVLAVLAATAATLIGASASDPPAMASTLASEISVSGHGNGHGHGMSQYGARGAAIAGLSTRRILAFYYPGTTLVTLRASIIRVRISGTGPYTTIAAGPSGLTVNGSALPVGPSIRKYRLVPSGTGLAVQRLGSAAGSRWVTYRRGLPSHADFASPRNYIRLHFTNGTSTSYRGKVGAVRSGSGLMTINRVSLDGYTAGVTPREMPASWQSAAVRAQAIAARTYGRNAVEHHRGAAYDICDTSQCQVYGGMRHYSSSGRLLWSDYPAAVIPDANQVLRYGGAAAFTQYSASSGGWTVSGGKPYLPAKRDGYDNAASGDPYRTWRRTVSLTSVARYYRLARVTSIRITRRDGHGDWGGRVLAGVVYGVESGGHARQVTTTGSALRAAMRLPSTWFRT